MGNEVATTEKSKVKNFLKSDMVQEQIKVTLGAKSSNFTASVLALVGQDELLRQAEPATILSSALTAAALDLPINKSLGFAHIIGYKNNQKGIVEAQFQMGWKGFVQLAQRSGHYKTINTTDVRAGEIKNRDRLSGEIEFDWADDGERGEMPIIGYVAYFRLTTGFEKTYYMSVEEVEEHAGRYSQSYKLDKKKGWTSSNWSKNFDAMAMKTVVKLLISKWGPMSTELEKAMIYDQAIIKGDKAEYTDGVDLETVGADDDAQKAIIEANTEDEDAGEDDTTPPPKGKVDEDATDAPDGSDGSDEEPPKQESVAEKARRKYGPKQPAKQSSLIGDEGSDNSA